MDDCSWIYRVSLERLCKIDYCNLVEGFINYKLSNLRNISEGDIRCLCKTCKNKKNFSIQMFLQYIFYKKMFIDKYLCWFTHEEPYVPYNAMVEMMIGSAISSIYQRAWSYR